MAQMSTSADLLDGEEEEVVNVDATQPLLLDTLVPLKHREMVDKEIADCSEYISKHPSRARFTLSPKRFVERSYVLHRQLIERWGGWEQDGEETPWSGNETERTAVYNAVVADMVAEFERQYIRLPSMSPRERASCSIFLRVIPKTLIGTTEAKRFAGAHYGTVSLTALLAHKTILSNYDDDFSLTHRSSWDRYSIQACERSGIALHTELVIWDKDNMRVLAKQTVRAGQRVSPAIVRLLTKLKLLERDDIRTLWSRLFERLGDEVWANKTLTLRTTFTCRPLAFLLLGSYGEKTCYTAGKERDGSRAFLAADVPNSFVLKVKRFAGKEGAAGRAWGIAQPGEFAVLTNFYLMSAGTLIRSLTPIVGKMFGLTNKPSVEAASSALGNLGRGAYINADGHAFYHPEPASKLTKQDIRYRIADLCGHCATYGFLTDQGVGPTRQDSYGYTHAGVAKRRPVWYTNHPNVWPYPDALLWRLTLEQFAELELLELQKKPKKKGTATNMDGRIRYNPTTRRFEFMDGTAVNTPVVDAELVRQVYAHIANVNAGGPQP